MNIMDDVQPTWDVEHIQVVDKGVGNMMPTVTPQREFVFFPECKWDEEAIQEAWVDEIDSGLHVVSDAVVNDCIIDANACDAMDPELEAILNDAILDFPCLTLKGMDNVLDEDKEVKEDLQDMESTTVQAELEAEMEMMVAEMRAPTMYAKTLVFEGTWKQTWARWLNGGFEIDNNEVHVHLWMMKSVK